MGQTVSRKGAKHRQTKGRQENHRAAFLRLLFLVPWRLQRELLFGSCPTPAGFDLDAFESRAAENN